MQQITTSSDKLTKKNIVNRQQAHMIPGGISVDLSTLSAGVVVPEGTPFSAPASGLRKVCKQALILAGSTTTVFKIGTDSNPFAVGEFAGRQTGGLAYAITDITDNGDGTTDITVGTALESATAGGFLYEMDAESSTTTSALENEPDCILAHAFQVPTTAQVIFKADGIVDGEVLEGAVGSEYLDLLKKVVEIKY